MVKFSDRMVSLVQYKYMSFSDYDLFQIFITKFKAPVIMITNIEELKDFSTTAVIPELVIFSSKQFKAERALHIKITCKESESHQGRTNMRDSIQMKRSISSQVKNIGRRFHLVRNEVAYKQLTCKGEALVSSEGRKRSQQYFHKDLTRYHNENSASSSDDEQIKIEKGLMAVWDKIRRLCNLNGKRSAYSMLN